MKSSLTAEPIQHLRSPWLSPLVHVLKINYDIRITVNYNKPDMITEVPQITIPRVDDLLSERLTSSRGLLR